jgi:hypothetical protein
LFNPRFGFVSDVDMWLRLAERFDIAYVPEPLITLPSRHAVPRIWGDGERRAQGQGERMFWEARMRHFRHRPARRFAEALRHHSFVAANDAWNFALAVNRRLRLFRRSGSR